MERSRARSTSVGSQRGSTLPEVLVTVAVIALTLSGSVLALNSTYEDRRTACQSFVNDVRMARMNSVTRGSHYRVTWSTNAYTVTRLRDDDHDGVWEAGDADLPRIQQFDGGVKIAVQSSPESPGATEIEFNTRGMVVDEYGGLSDIIRISLTDQGTGGGTAHIEIWPSGQIYLLSGQEGS